MLPPSSVVGRYVPTLYSPGELYSTKIEVTKNDRFNDRMPAFR